MNQALQQAEFLARCVFSVALAAASGPAVVAHSRVALGRCAGRVLTQHLSPGSLFAFSCSSKRREFWYRLRGRSDQWVSVPRLKALNPCGAAEGCFAEK